jgi:hypothetical protein
MALCPTCFSVIGTWSDDPILTTPALSVGYSGFTQVEPTHIIELQNLCNVKEIEAELTPTVWTHIDNVNIYQVIKICIQELRLAIQNLVTTVESDMYHYFNYDKDGNYMGTTQTDWYDSDLNSNFVQIKAIHIEDLRHVANLNLNVLPIEDGYLLAHAHNPEGKEISGIGWGGFGNASIYIDGILSGISGSPITLSPGHYSVQCRFNNLISGSQEVDIISGETSELIFSFDRTEIDVTVGYRLGYQYQDSPTGISFDLSVPHPAPFWVGNAIVPYSGIPYYFFQWKIATQDGDDFVFPLLQDSRGYYFIDLGGYTQYATQPYQGKGLIWGTAYIGPEHIHYSNVPYAYEDL